MSIRILLVDDHEIIRLGLKAILAQHKDLEVVAEASDGREALGLVEKHSPDVVIMDVAMPGLNGIDGTLRIREQFPAVRVIVLSMHLERSYVGQTLKAGAYGYVLKERAVEELVPAIRSVRAGRKFLSPGVTDIVLAGYLESNAEAPPSSAFSDLTARERDVLQHIAEGRSIKEIGDILHLSPKTIETHKRRIMERLNITSVAGLTRYAVRHGLVSLE
jgi:DNA-binding NarL/FixJ family response regulator